MAANSNKQTKNTNNVHRENRIGIGSETFRFDDTGEEEDHMEVGWTQVNTGKKGNKKRKKGREGRSESSSSLGSEEDVDEGNKNKSELRVILKFKEEAGVSGVNPLALTYELKKWWVK